MLYKFTIEGFFPNIGIRVEDKNIKVRNENYEEAKILAIDIMSFRYNLNKEDCHIITSEIIK